MWKRRTALLPSRGYRVRASGVLVIREQVIGLNGVKEERWVPCKAAVDAKPICVYVTMREYRAKETLWKVLEGVLREEGFEPCF